MKAAKSTRSASPGATGLVAVATMSLGLSACLSGPGFLKQKAGSLDSATVRINATVLADQGGVVTAQIGANSHATQEVAADPNSDIKGTTISFPPGSVAVATNVTVQTGAALASTGFASQIGLDQSNKVTAASPTVVVQSSTPTDPITPFTVSVQLNSAQTSLLDAGGSYAVLYNMFIASQNVYHQGILPQSDVTISGNTASFLVAHFGAFQLVVTAAPVVAQQDVQAAVPIVTQAQVQAAPFSLANFTPYGVLAGKVVTLSGANFRPTMTVALGNRPISNLTVMSDSAASFTMPADQPFGFTDLVVQQDGTQETHKLFAMADKADLPLIMVDPAGVCSGTNYYDVNGNKQVGTMACATPQATPTPFVLPAGVMLQSTYDKKATGTVDGAKSSNEAAFAVGTSGTAINVGANTSIMPLPGDGSTYVVNGSGQITAIQNAPVGTRITLVFGAGSNITFMHNESTASQQPLLLMLAGQPYNFLPGESADFLATQNGWTEIAQGYRPAMVQASATAALSFPLEGNGTGTSYSTDTTIPYNQINNEFQNSFANGVFTAPVTGTYQVNAEVYGEFPSYESMAYCYLSVYKNAQATPLASTSMMFNGSPPYGCVVSLNQGFLLSAGDHLEFKTMFNYYTATPSGNAIIKPSGTIADTQGQPAHTFLRIIKVN